MNAKQIIFTQKDTALLLDVEDNELAPDQVMVQTLFSTISCGTERANITGDPNVSICGDGNVKFPRTAGYSSSGIIVKKGANVQDLEIGDAVVMSWSLHKSYNILQASNVVKINNDKIPMEEAALLHIATFPMAAIRKTRLEIGESALVMGLGILGLMAVKIAKAAGGVPVIAADPVAARRELALSYGADYAFDPTAPDFAQKVKEVTEGGVNIAIEVTGVGAGLNNALDCMAKFGRIALLGCTRSSDFSIDYYRKVHGPGITMIGAHTMARPTQESHPGWFIQRDDIKALIRLCEHHRVDFAEMIQETYSPADCTEVYTRLINDRAFPPVVQFDWSRLEP